MASLQHVVQAVLLNDYITLIILTAVGYDYILMFSDEIEHIWSRRWTGVSALYFITRYVGLGCIVLFSLLRFYQMSSCIGFFYVSEWAVVIFLAAVDLVMILRVWALYNQSRTILGVLLAFYVVEVILYLIDCIKLISEKDIAVLVPLSDLTFCGLLYVAPKWTEISMIAGQITLGLVMCGLVTVRFIRESLQKRATKQSKPNRYSTLLTTDGMIYFIVTVLYAFMTLLPYIPSVSLTGWSQVVAAILNFVPIFTLIPRFILSLRQLYARDLHGMREIDTAFGLTPTLEHGTVNSAIVFAGSGGNRAEEQGEEQGEEILMTERAMHGSSGDV